MACDSKPTSKILNLDDLNEFLYSRDNSINNLYFSDIPEVCKEFPCILGIDEAGRGPVLGPMVYGTAFCPLNEMILLETMNCADSKVLTEEKREEIFGDFCKNAKVGWGVEVISPNTISNNMLDRTKCSLNQISMDSAILLIKTAIDKGVRVEHIYVDTVGPPEKYQDYLRQIFPKCQITVAKKADSTYPIVSAASICAKVTRDHALQMWTFREQLTLTHKDFGSGYPGDPLTKKFMIDYCDPIFGFPMLVRFGWSTASNALENAYYIEWEEDEKVEEAKNTTTITSFFKMTPKSSIKRKRHEFFADRGLERTTEL